MKKFLLTLDEDSANLLKRQPNKSAYIRQALKIYNEDISTDTIAGLREAYKQIIVSLDDINKKLDYLDRKIK